jgi:hypothetical protein
MDQAKSEDVNLTDCENVLDANWNERKHLIDDAFALRLEIQELLVNGDSRFAEVRQKELACNDALRRNEEEYDLVVSKWGAEVTSRGTQ